MEGRFWKWRMHGGPVTLADETHRRIDGGLSPDVILATDMVDVPSYLGLVRNPAVSVPVVLFCHENQLSYPVSPRSQEDLTFGAMNWKSMLAADRVLFNSQFHFDEVFAMLPGFLKNFPDYRHLDKIESVRNRSGVLPAGVDIARLPPARRFDPPLILWAQRWEHDKNPTEMIETIDRLIDSGKRFRIALAGENFRNEPAEFLAARNRWGDRLVQFGWADQPTYDQLVADADIVISTALHEFFGIAVVEAIAAGAWPILPNRLSYPELLDPAHSTEHLYNDADELLAMLEHTIANIEARRAASGRRRIYYQRYDWSQVAPQYDQAFEDLAAGQAL